jgi:hypothetical protein
MSLLDFVLSRRVSSAATPVDTSRSKRGQKRLRGKGAPTLTTLHNTGAAVSLGPNAQAIIGALPPPHNEVDASATHVESESSAAVEKRQKVDNRRMKYKRARAKLPAVLPTQQAVTRTSATMQDVRVLGFDDLMDEYPHTRVGLGEDSPVTTHDPEPQQPPPISDVLRKHVAALPRPDYIVHMQHGVSQEELIRQLERRVLALPIQKASFESQLLAEGGSHPVKMLDGTTQVFMFPYCVRGRECIGFTGGIDGFTQQVRALSHTQTHTHTHTHTRCSSGARCHTHGYDVGA